MPADKGVEQKAAVVGIATPGLQNNAAEYNCFLNCILQCLWNCQELTATILSWQSRHLQVLTECQDQIGLLQLLFPVILLHVDLSSPRHYQFLIREQGVRALVVDSQLLGV